MDEKMIANLARDISRNNLPIDMLLNLTGKTAVVTGGASGLGYSIVSRLAEAGAAVVIVGRNEGKNQKAVAEFKEIGYRVAAFAGDVSKVEDCYAAVDFAVQTFGSVDIAVTNAAVFSRSAFVDVTEEMYDRTIDICTKGQFFMAQAAARQMIKQGRGGKIVLTASLARRSAGMPLLAFQPHYDVAKGAIPNMAKTLAQNLKQYNIQVNCVSPGAMMTVGALTSTQGAEKVYGEKYISRNKEIQAMNIGAPFSSNPDEVARMVYIMCTRFSDFMQGAVVDVDGGSDLSFQTDPWSYTLEGCIPGPQEAVK